MEPPAAREATASMTPPARGSSPSALMFHGTQWFEVNQSVLEQEINGTVVQRFWSINDSRTGAILECNICDQGNLASRLDYFHLMFPPQSLLLIVRLISQGLLLQSKPTTTKGEIVKFFGMIILSTKFEFDNRRSLWAATAPSKYIPTPMFGKLMPPNSFDDLWRCIRLSDQPSVRPADMMPEQYRWKFVDDFVTRFNKHCGSTFSPSERICVDESISRWYGKGGQWINHGLPMNIAIYCIMLRLKLVKTAEEEA